jgi:hypothetical protein
MTYPYILAQQKLVGLPGAIVLDPNFVGKVLEPQKFVGFWDSPFLSD